jgi:hypothetical protein
MPKKKENHFQKGTKRIKQKDHKEYVKTESDWMLDSEIPENIKQIIEFYQENENIDLLIDEINNDFFKGFLDPENRPSGQRIKMLPSGKKLARGGFSIFSKNLRFNDNGEHLWDVCFENPSGTLTYLYNEDKIQTEKEKKALLVDEFEKHFEDIMIKLTDDLKKKKSVILLALYTLLKTNIRVGNLEYYNHLKHKGLTTLQKSDIKIRKNNVTFEYIAKDGIPQKFVVEFPDFYIDLLRKHLTKLKIEDFVFAVDSKPIHAEEFSKILFEYTGVHFYPHIIRSYYADSKCKEFLKNHSKATKKEVDEFLLDVAKNLGHKKYDKKSGEFIPNYKVTIENYIRPNLYNNLTLLIENAD